MLARSQCTHSTILSCSSMIPSCSTMRKTQSEGCWYQWKMQKFWMIVMTALSGPEGRRSSHKWSTRSQFVLYFVLISMFFTMSIVSATAAQFPFLEGAMEPFRLWNSYAQGSGLCCTLVQKKDNLVCSMLEVVYCNKYNFIISPPLPTAWERPFCLGHFEFEPSSYWGVTTKMLHLEEGPILRGRESLQGPPRPS